jgi:hypothetical protein
MTEARSGAGRLAAGALALAAAPTFGLMALVTGLLGGGTRPDMPGMAAHDPFALDGMALMYLLMAAFHLPAWLKRLPSRREPARMPAAAVSREIR